MELCLFSVSIGFAIASFLFLFAWGFTMLGKFLVRSEKKDQKKMT